MTVSLLLSRYFKFVRQ